MDNSEVLTCDDCKQAALDVKEVVCPIFLAIYKRLGKLCDECYELRCDEI